MTRMMFVFFYPDYLDYIFWKKNFPFMSSNKICLLDKGPSLYYVSIFLAFLYPTAHPPNHLISINTVLNVSKTGHFLNPPTQLLLT